MSAATPVRLGGYLNTEYEPDCEYLDGVLEERNAGKRKHSQLQALLGAKLLAEARELGYEVLTGQRVQTSPTRVRIPDICLIALSDSDEVTQRPPALWIEILSPDDRWSRIQSKLRDVLAFGVPTVWILDPYDQEAWVATPESGVIQVLDGVLRAETLDLAARLGELWPVQT